VEERILDPRKTAEDEQLSAQLRPLAWEAFIGQPHVILPLRRMLAGAKERREAAGHILLHSPPGLGKTTLARLAAAEAGTLFYSESGPMFNMGYLRWRLGSLFERSILFIDEIHTLRGPVKETLYLAMEDFRLEVPEKGESITIRCPPFTLIAATTRAASLPPPFRDRFDLILRIHYYSVPELMAIARQSAQRLMGEQEPPAAIQAIALRSRGTPRIVNRFVKRARDYGGLSGFKEMFEELGIDRWGLDETDRRLLSIIRHQFGGGPVGLPTLAAAMGDDEKVIAEMYEPYLLRSGLLVKTPRGRMLTNLGAEAIKSSKKKTK